MLNRGALIGLIVAILGTGVAAAESTVAAKPARGHHARCARTAKSKAKRAKRRAKCKKVSKALHKVLEPALSPAVTAPAPPEVPRPNAPPTTTATPSTPIGTTAATTAPVTTITESTRGFVPPGISVVSVFAEATYPRDIAASEAITEPHAIAELIDLTEGLERLPSEHGLSTCRAAFGELKLELSFRESLQAQPSDEVTVTAARCGIVYIRMGDLMERAKDPQTVIALTESLLGVEL